MSGYQNNELIEIEALCNENTVGHSIWEAEYSDLIAMGGMHTTYPSLIEICESLDKANIDIPIIVGGWIAKTLDHMIWPRIPNVDILCRQEGEYVVDSICNHFPALDKIKGIEMVSISSLTEGINGIIDEADRQAIVNKVSESIQQFDRTQANLDELVLLSKSELIRAKPIISELTKASIHLNNKLL